MQKLFKILKYKKLEAIGVVEVILILVILIGLVIIFKGEIETIVNNVFENITSGVSDVLQ